jgi:hypothetical protein
MGQYGVRPVPSTPSPPSIPDLVFSRTAASGLVVLLDTISQYVIPLVHLMAFGATGPHERGLQRLTTDLTGMMVVRVLPVWGVILAPPPRYKICRTGGMGSGPARVRYGAPSAHLQHGYLIMKPSFMLKLLILQSSRHLVHLAILGRLGGGSALSHRQHVHLSLRRKRNHGDPLPFFDAQDQYASDVGSPSCSITKERPAATPPCGS